jgi:hypothetical protein
VGRIGLEKMVAELKTAAADGQQRAASAGRTGLRQGKVSELTSIMTFAPEVPSGSGRCSRQGATALGGGASAVALNNNLARFIGLYWRRHVQAVN